jgi:ERCC4-type nuclease
MIAVPFVILVDQREGLPYSFRGLRADADKERRMLDVRTRTEYLITGDYTISGMEDRIAIERKSLSDLFGSCGGGRERFQAEHERLSTMEFSAVVIESSLSEMLRNPPATSRMLPKSIFRTSLSWPIRYGVHWIWAGDRRMGEICTFRLLEKFYQHTVKEKETDHVTGRNPTITRVTQFADPTACPF